MSWGKKYLSASMGLALMLGMQSYATAGIYMGAESDHSDTSLYFIGAQTDDPLFVNVFVGDLAYEYRESGAVVEVDSTIVSPTVGYRFDGPITVSVAAGVTWTEETETRGSVEATDDHTGAVLQFGLSRWRPENNHELLISYNDATEFVWTRARGKHLYKNNLFFGAELFWMGNDEFRSQGVGGLIELRGNRVSGLLKAGVSDIRDGDNGIYGGIEISIPF